MTSIEPIQTMQSSTDITTKNDYHFPASKNVVEEVISISPSQQHTHDASSTKSQAPPPPPPPPEPQSRSPFRTALTLFALFLTLFVAALDATIVATAVATISHDLHSATGYTWIGGSYMIANAVAAPIWASLSDIWGRKLVMLTALAVFAVASAICASAGTMKLLLAGRALQGTAGGGLILMVHIVISDTFSVKRRSLWLGVTEGVWAAAGAAGPPLGGVFANFNYRWIFWINLPITGLAFLLLLLFLDVKHSKTPFTTGIKAVDWWGILTFLAFSLMLLLGLDFGGAVFAWSSAKVICLIVIGTLMLGAFVYSESKLARYPLIPLNLFKDRSNIAALAVTGLHGFAFISGEYYFPLYLQGVKQQSPIRSGVLLVPLVVATAGFGVLSGIFIHKTGRYRELIWVGTTIMTIALGIFITLDVTSSLGKIIGFTILFGLGSGMLFEPPLIAIQTRTEQQNVATATSTFAFCRSIAVAMSVIIGGVVFQNSMDVQAKHLAAAGLPASIVQQLSGKEAAANIALASRIEDPVQKRAVQAAFAAAMKNMWALYTAVAGLAVVVGLFVKRGKLSEQHVETVTGLRAEKKGDDEGGEEVALESLRTAGQAHEV